MKIASSSMSFDKSLSQGDLTQLEWLHLCASSLALDGIVFEARHFPRLDDEYLAQLKKTAIDLGLTVAAVAADALLEADGARWIAVAERLGAPLVIARTPPATDRSSAWNDLATALKQIASVAKHANVAIALRNDPQTLCAEASDLKRLSKDVDSSWIRHALDLTTLSNEERAEPMLARSVIACLNVGTADEGGAAERLRLPHAFRAFLVIDALDEHLNEENLARLIRRVRFSETPYEGVKT